MTEVKKATWLRAGLGAPLTKRIPVALWYLCLKGLKYQISFGVDM